MMLAEVMLAKKVLEHALEKNVGMDFCYPQVGQISRMTGLVT